MFFICKLMFLSSMVYRECAQWTREQIRAGNKITSQQAAKNWCFWVGLLISPTLMKCMWCTAEKCESFTRSAYTTLFVRVDQAYNLLKLINRCQSHPPQSSWLHDHVLMQRCLHAVQMTVTRPIFHDYRVYRARPGNERYTN